MYVLSVEVSRVKKTAWHGCTVGTSNYGSFTVVYGSAVTTVNGGHAAVSVGRRAHDRVLSANQHLEWRCVEIRAFESTACCRDPLQHCSMVQHDF